MNKRVERGSVPLPTSGELAPDFCLRNAEGKTVCLHDARGKWVVLYFYPKDNTPGCTLEAVSFTASFVSFQEAGAVVWGVSPDSEKSHCSFRDRHALTITLLSDPHHEVISRYGAWVEKQRFGKRYWGVLRSTFLIDPKGRIAAVWRDVSVKGHVDTVYRTLIGLKGSIGSPSV